LDEVLVLKMKKCFIAWPPSPGFLEKDKRMRDQNDEVCDATEAK